MQLQFTLNDTNNIFYVKFVFVVVSKLHNTNLPSHTSFMQVICQMFFTGFTWEGFR